MNYAVRTERANTEKYVESASKGMKGCKLTSYKDVLGSSDCGKAVSYTHLRAHET